MAQTEKRLIGEDAELYLDEALVNKIAAGVTIVGNFYQVVAKGGSTALPAGLDVGDWFVAESIITLATGDIVDEAAPTNFIDVTGYSVEMSKAEIDVTTLSDVIKSYRAGKTDMTGSFDGISTINALAATDQVARNAVYARFINTITQDGTTIVSSGGGVDTLAYFFGYLNKTAVTGEVEEVLVLPVRLTSMTLASVSVDGAQTFSGNFRIDGSKKPCLLQREVQ
jgi:hypothetical protein